MPIVSSAMLRRNFTKSVIIFLQPVTQLIRILYDPVLLAFMAQPFYTTVVPIFYTFHDCLLEMEKCS
jgi:hypothetical protein